MNCIHHQPSVSEITPEYYKYTHATCSKTRGKCTWGKPGCSRGSTKVVLKDGSKIN